MRKILIVDDDENIRALMMDTFSGTYRIEAVEDGLEAMASILRDKPDIVIIDFNMNMPALDGISVVKYILETPRNADIKFILISGLLDVEKMAKWKASVPGSLFFKKPFMLQDIEDACAALMKDKA
jgi:CheY-like chemotaxis protein